MESVVRFSEKVWGGHSRGHDPLTVGHSFEQLWSSEKNMMSQLS
jgi:hypothetical protein